jgi:glutaconate CoA-transferase subunit A
LEELSLGMLTAALQAAAWDVPFVPIANLEETAYVSEGLSAGRLDYVDSAFGRSLVVGALRPDVAFVHADAVDTDGNATIRGPYGEAALAAAASTTTVVIAEEVVTSSDLRRRSAECVIPGLVVDLIVEQPGAVVPDGAIGRYPRDVEAYLRYTTAARDLSGFQAWLDQYVFSGGRS